MPTDTHKQKRANVKAQTNNHATSHAKQSNHIPIQTPKQARAQKHITRTRILRNCVCTNTATPASHNVHSIISASKQTQKHQKYTFRVSRVYKKRSDRFLRKRHKRNTNARAACTCARTHAHPSPQGRPYATQSITYRRKARQWLHEKGRTA